MHYKNFSKKELSDILYLIHRCVQCRTEDDIIGVVWRLKEMACADNGVCALGDTSGNILKIINVNYPVDWLEAYASEELYKNDPVIRFNYTFFKTHFWSEALQRFSDEPYMDLMNRASEFKLRYGMAGGVNGSGQDCGSIFSFSSDRNGFTAHHLKILDVLTPHIHQALLRICRDSQSPTAYVLSKREKEVMNWMKEGKTNWEISVILNISERTVKFHVQNIERKLNAVNKAHAIAIAMDNGLVF
ncbi:MAG: autoinducer binding domain-containing protein [Deltaproteobacteria bacterium]|nr:autoinducer binding domain-containing protein [Deltaproteobacteria bacterium]